MRTCGVWFVPAQAMARRSRACASANSCWNGQAEAMATVTRRTLRLTRAPIFSNSDPAQGAEQDVRHGSEPQPQLIGAHAGSRRAIGEQIQLAFLDAVLHLAT